MTPSQKIFFGQIKNCQERIDGLYQLINDIAKTYISDFCWLDHKVSTLWECEESPIGMCVYNLNEGVFNINCRCRYCGNPVERK